VQVEFFQERCHAEWEADLAAVDKEVVRIL
jgi:hypothetical protein